MSDSDSDDDLLLSSGPVFRKTARQERAADKKRATGLAYLNDGLEDEKKRNEFQIHLSQIKQEHEECNEARLTQAETIAKEASTKRKAGATSPSNSSTLKGGLAALALRDQLATALDTSHTNNLGTRRVLGGGNEKDQWATVEFALEDLNEILKRMQSNNKSKEEGKAFRTAIVSLLQTAIKEKMLPRVLLTRKLAKLCQKHEMMFLPQELTEWLYCMACNPIDEEQSDLSTGAFQTLLTILCRAQGSPKKNKPLFTMQDLIRDFEAWFGLRIIEGTKANDEKENQEVGTALSTTSVLGLEHFLLLWERVLLNDIVAFDKAASAETATQCMVALACVSLDPCFYKGEGLCTTFALQRVIIALLSFVARNIVTDPNELNTWIETTTSAILDQCKKLALGPTTDQHHDDDEVWLCLSLVTRAVCAFDECGASIDDIHRQFRVAISIQALQSCLEVEEWGTHMQTVLSERGETELPDHASHSLAWRAIASAYAGFLTIPRFGSAMAKNGQRSLATAQLLTYCILSGITFHSSPIDVDSQDDDAAALKGIFGTTEEASLLLRILQVLETECRQFASRMAMFSSDPNFSCGEYLLSCLRRYNDHVRLKARVIAGETGSPVTVQKSIRNYFGNSQGSDDMDE